MNVYNTIKMAETFHFWDKSSRIPPVDKKGSDLLKQRFESFSIFAKVIAAKLLLY